ncbi:hypothetical protein [Leeuwenhoekiella palythoae]|uniref:hypothetical protein n=1 Tax=Leeuwenhoekiella palythoae TaxID=573501 RepID=UPI003511C4CF|tara:strand:- start:363 stop:623 length:261 start_codon:yes stop_codon:yes gene_type:complete
MDKSSKQELLGLANDYYINSMIVLLDQTDDYVLYEVYYRANRYTFCIANREHSYIGKAPIFYFNNHSETFARNLCWKKIIEPNIGL